MPEGANRMEDSPDNPFADPTFTQEVRRRLLKFARLQLGAGGDHSAEDVVQEALLAAMENASTFARRAELQTWVFAILKNKIADSLRRKIRSRETVASQLMRPDDDEAPTVFDERGMWMDAHRPRAWIDPEATLHQSQFWQVFDVCLEALPGKQARIFMMREYVGLDTEEVCAALGTTSNNMHVLLHRARLRLRECLERNWFLAGERP
jgi:RNA polymerase sigma-70 factor (TIGR02943 family)